MRKYFILIFLSVLLCFYGCERVACNSVNLTRYVTSDTIFINGPLGRLHTIVDRPTRDNQKLPAVVIQQTCFCPYGFPAKFLH